MRNYLTVLGLLVLCLGKDYAQQFSAKLVFKDALNNKDSVIIGYDPSATNGIDAALGEIDVSTTSLNAVMDVRLSDHISSSISSEQCGKQTANYTYMSKKQIVNSSCGFYLPNGNSSIHSILIKCKHYPLTITWNPTLFNTICNQNVLITDLQPYGWFDLPCNGASAVVNFKDYSSLVRNPNPYPQYLVQGNDTLYIMYYASSFALAVNKNNFVTPNIKVYPSPSNGIVRLEMLNTNINEHTLRLTNILGKDEKFDLLNDETDILSLNINHLKNGVYFLHVFNKDRLIHTKKIIKE